MPKCSIRFPEDLHAAITAEAERRGKPWTFSSVLVEWAGVGHRRNADHARFAEELAKCGAEPQADSIERELAAERHDCAERFAKPKGNR